MSKSVFKQKVRMINVEMALEQLKQNLLDRYIPYRFNMDIYQWFKSLSYF